MLIWQSALELSHLVRARKLSPVEIANAVLSRIEALNPTLNAFCVVAADQARAAAREAEIAVAKGEPLGPLHGVPVSIKDVLSTRGLKIGRASCRERVESTVVAAALNIKRKR